MDMFFIEIIEEVDKNDNSMIKFSNLDDNEDFGPGLAVCPVCGKRSLKVEDGCYTCINPKCGYSKCDH